MPNENLLATLEQSLRHARAARNRLATRLAELEAEADTVRQEIAEMDTLASQTEASIFRLMSSMLSTGVQSASGAAPSDLELEAAMRRDVAARSTYAPKTVPLPHDIPSLRPNIEVKSDRFTDRTIPQATTMLLREAGEPLHVNEIYNRLVEGGFNFTGHNPTISIAVSLNRNGRFRKVAPGTFDLVMRDASQAL
ncbi:MAG: hypothetical protein ICV60_08385 [Pyrinomonadaceae bacterium]|nr:hypothetical protein [Pyrinomonadaceae bacterium]